MKIRLIQPLPLPLQNKQARTDKSLKFMIQILPCSNINRINFQYKKFHLNDPIFMANNPTELFDIAGRKATAMASSLLTQRRAMLKKHLRFLQLEKMMGTATVLPAAPALAATVANETAFTWNNI
ncbi:hypothetical protein KFK09_003483 [Dendrobium nobile]|uniref:Uncharacterized protein n=1 Tax=Dendrobium nobile TaxID=94219 RepID=A0A8T3BXY8_DENNO|nr:hypothetical protein KFK09_003483 [Dendrobium nobile]